tara:strand:+ start:466 stop:1293 length:828 start_codon:yes stop_codon:yes gene_type:complete
MAMDPYQTLGVDQSASDQQIKAAFRKLAVQYHPDRGGDEDKFKEINEAYDKIKTQEKRQQYEASKRFGGDGFNFNFTQGDPFDMQDMFTQFFGEGFANSRRSRRPHNKPIQIAIECTLEDVYYGSKKEIQIDQTGKTMVIDIPQGIDNGQTIRYKGLGMNQIKNAPAGDLLCKIKVKNHPIFYRQKLDLHTEQTVNCFQAILGTKIIFEHIDSKKITLKIPPGTQPGTTMRIPEHGMTGMNRRTGHLYVHVNVAIPTNLKEKDKNEIKSISESYS